MRVPGKQVTLRREQTQIVGLASHSFNMCEQFYVLPLLGVQRPGLPSPRSRRAVSVQSGGRDNRAVPTGDVGTSQGHMTWRVGTRMWCRKKGCCQRIIQGRERDLHSRQRRKCAVLCREGAGGFEVWQPCH